MRLSNAFVSARVDLKWDADEFSLYEISVQKQ
jgi:hypothetical protein